MVAFGSTVTIQHDHGRKHTYRIVGTDEADPAHGTLSDLAPLARALIGKAVGERTRIGSTVDYCTPLTARRMAWTWTSAMSTSGCSPHRCRWHHRPHPRLANKPIGVRTHALVSLGSATIAVAWRPGARHG